MVFIHFSCIPVLSMHMCVYICTFIAKRLDVLLFTQMQNVLIKSVAIYKINSW